MSIWSWRTSSDGSVMVDRGDGQGYARPTSLPHPQVLDTQKRVLGWRQLAGEAAAKYNVPLSWILATVYAESGGDAAANNAPQGQCPATTTWHEPGCVGLMAIYLAAHHKTLDDMLDPAKNLDYGTSMFAKSRSHGYDLPVSASIHVAGGGTTYTPHSGSCDSALLHPDHPDGSPWGMCEHMFSSTQGDGAVGYIDRVVRANNTFIDLLGQRQDAPEEPVPGEDGQAGTQAATAGAPVGRLAVFSAWCLLGYLAITRLSEGLRSR